MSSGFLLGTALALLKLSPHANDRKFDFMGGQINVKREKLGDYIARRISRLSDDSIKSAIQGAVNDFKALDGQTAETVLSFIYNEEKETLFVTGLLIGPGPEGTVCVRDFNSKMTNVKFSCSWFVVDRIHSGEIVSEAKQVEGAEGEHNVTDVIGAALEGVRSENAPPELREAVAQLSA